MFYSESIISVRYAETDKMGIVHHSNYLVWFEVGRTDFIKKVGMSYTQIEELGIMLPIRSVQAEYFNPAKYEDDVVVKTFIIDFTAVRLTLGYEVYLKNTNEILTKGHTQHVWTSKDLKPINIKKKSQEIYELFIQKIQTNN